VSSGKRVRDSDYEYECHSDSECECACECEYEYGLVVSLAAYKCMRGTIFIPLIPEMDEFGHNNRLELSRFS